jgi:hypothetical protein
MFSEVQWLCAVTTSTMLLRFLFKRRSSRLTNKKMTKRNGNLRRYLLRFED